MQMKRVCMYLRKSRADLEAEARGEGETLARHRRTLLHYAQENKLEICSVREEIASGESLVKRPQMLLLLEEVSSRLYDAVLCMDIDRLGRGNMREQGFIFETFKTAETKIITPRKVYDLNDEWDEEYSEFEAFMARKELKIITRRMQGGRIRSAQEGNYIASRPPYGYSIHKEARSRYLVPHPEQHEVVKMVFAWYTCDVPADRRGATDIARELNRMGYQTSTGKEWTADSVLAIVKNPVYAGRIRWNQVDVPGKHEPLVSMGIYKKALGILQSKSHAPHPLKHRLSNPLAGLIKCAVCKKPMVLRPYAQQKPHLMCPNRKSCGNKSSRFEYVESRLLDSLKRWLQHYSRKDGFHSLFPCPEEGISSIKEIAMKRFEKERGQIKTQRERLHDFLERGVYDLFTYTQRMEKLAERLEQMDKAIEDYKADLQKQEGLENLPRIELQGAGDMLDLYNRTESAELRNNLIRSILEKAEYRKETWQRNDEFTLVVYPKVPERKAPSVSDG